MSLLSAMAKLETAAELRGYSRGYDAAQRLNESGYGSGQHAVYVLTGPSKRSLRKDVQARNWRREGDNPGQAFAGSCEVLRWHKGDSDQWQAICLGSIYYDV